MASPQFWSGTAVITGAGLGLGAAMAHRFADAGMAIACLDIDADRAAKTSQTILNRGGKAMSLGVDVANRSALEQAAQRSQEALGAITVLAANVGVQQFGPIEKLSEAEWRWVLDVNVLGLVNTVTAFLPMMRQAHGNRRILLTASSAVLVPGARLGAYTASKFAVMGLGETMRIELEAEGIGVSVLFPAGMSSRHLESSQLAKPSRIAGPVMSTEDIEIMLASRSMDGAEHVATPEHATRHLLAELAANEAYIVTHGQYRAEMVQRLEAVIAAYDRAQN